MNCQWTVCHVGHVQHTLAFPWDTMCQWEHMENTKNSWQRTYLDNRYSRATINNMQDQHDDGNAHKELAYASSKANQHGYISRDECTHPQYEGEIYFSQQFLLINPREATCSMEWVEVKIEGAGVLFQSGLFNVMTGGI